MTTASTDSHSSSRKPAIAFAYLIPAFPGQTHAFFWRERLALRDLGVETALVSTQPPGAQIRAPHDWAGTAEQETHYLLPLAAGGMLEILWELLRAGPMGWARVFSTFFRSRTDGLRDRLKLLAAVFLGARLAAFCRRASIRHVHVHSCGNSLNIALFAHRLGGLTYSMTLHGPLGSYGSNQPLKWRHARFAVVITQTLRQAVEKELAGFLPPVLGVAPMGVDTAFFSRESPYPTWHPTHETLHVFSCGRLNPCKRHDVLVRAIHELTHRGIPADLIIAGADDTPGHLVETELRRLAAELNISDRVFLAGKQSEHQVRQSLETAHVFALASDSEALGVALMEAMAMEVPVVGTQVGGVHELLQNAGQLQVPAGDAIAMAEGILTAAQNAANHPMQLRKARELVEQRFGSRRSAELLVRLLQST